MSETMQQEWVRRCKDKCERILRLLAMNAPDPIIANEIAWLFYMACGYLGRDTTDELSMILVKSARQSIGRCGNPDCDNEISVFKSYHPICPDCEAHDQKWRLRYEVESENGEKDGDLYMEEQKEIEERKKKK